MAYYQYLIKYLKESIMNTIPAQEIKRRGITAVDKLIAAGDVHVIRNNRPEYVVLTEERYRELVAEVEEAYVARVKASLEDVKAGRVRRFASVDELLQALDADGE
jgi:PHD/YefM family antitoxin component YafN of YafNO toxin-antitoxin module